MKTKEFNKCIDLQIEKCRNVLIKKSDEYAGDTDRLHNFRAFADLAGITMEQACGGFLGKHLVSIYDMIKTQGAEQKITYYTDNAKALTVPGPMTEYTLDQWDEKIGDAINYLLILSAILRREDPAIHGCERKTNFWAPYEEIDIK